MRAFSDDTQFDVDPNQIVVDARNFANWRNGLPEWTKNSSDAYERAISPTSDRVIVIIFAVARDNVEPALACLDLVGMTSDDLTRKLARYGDPQASGRGDHIAGGHGNGGKLFAVGGFGAGVVWKTVKHGLRNEYGLASPGRPEFAFVVDKNGEVRDRLCSNVAEALEEWLSDLGLSTLDLPDVAKEGLKKAVGTTMVVGYGPQISSQLLERQVVGAVQGHPQSRIPLETGQLYVLVDGKLLNRGQPLALEPIEPYEGFAEPNAIRIPASLKDPFDQSQVSTTPSDVPGLLKLFTSDKQMPSNRALQGRHTIDFKQGAKLRGSRAVRELVGKGAFTDRIYGEVQLEALTDVYESQTRGPLAETPLVRSLEQWVSEQVIAYAAEIEMASMVHERAARDREKTIRLIQQMERLNNWINRVVNEISSGPGDELDLEQGGRKPGAPRSPLPVAKLGRIEITIDERVAGTKIPLQFSTAFYGLDDTRIRPLNVTWHSSDLSVAAYSSITGMINTYRPGSSEIWCESSTGVVSNRIELQVIDCDRIELDVETVDVPIGGRRRIWATGITADGQRYEGIRLNWTTDSADLLRVGLAGIVTGLREGTATVTAREGDGTAETCVVAVVPAPEGPGGPRRPRYLLSEVQKAPYDKEPPAFHKDSGLVTQRQSDIEHNVWWINLASPLARLVYDQHGEVSEPWAMYLGERMADAAIEAAMQGADRGVESRPVNEVLDQISQHRMEILESFTEEFGATRKLVL